jgi:hypothetical protein
VTDRSWSGFDALRCLTCDFEMCLRDLRRALNVRLINAKQMKSDGDLYGVQRAVSMSVSVSVSVSFERYG